MTRGETASGVTEPGWSEALRQDQLLDGRLKAVRCGGRPLVLGRAPDGTPFALDNRCPHEGYPLATGSLAGGLLTCAWHNWKFDVRSGACVTGGDAVRSWPARERAGRIEVDLTPPDPATERRAGLAALEQSILDGDVARALREVARLIVAGVPPVELLSGLAAYDARHAEWGVTHVVAGAADALWPLGEAGGAADGRDVLRVIAPVLDLCVDANRRLPPRPAAPPVQLEPGRAAPALRAAIEAEQGEQAEGIVRGALAATPPRVVLGWLVTAAADHFTDFGHQLIFLVKLDDLLARAGAGHAEDLLAGLTRSLVTATREDLLPYFRPFTARLAAVAGELPALHAAAGAVATHDGPALQQAVLDGSPAVAFEAVLAALRAGSPAPAIARDLVVAAAQRLLRFDARLDRDPHVAENWLFASHRLTFAAAVRHVLERFPAADHLRLLFQAAAFITTGRALDAAPRERADVAPAAPAAVADVLAAVRAGRPADAVRAAAACLQDESVAGALRAPLLQFALAGHRVRPIYAVHDLKTVVVGFEERDALGDVPDRDLPVLAAVRLLAAPIREATAATLVESTWRFVADGQPPRKLTQ